MNPARKPIFLTAYAACAYAFLYFPIAVLILYSFNRDGVGGFPPRHLTFDWYRVLFADSAMWSAVENSAIVALAAVVISILIGFPAAYALDRYSFPGKAAFQRLVLLPLIVPGVITGISLLLLTVSSGFHLSLVTVILGHSTALTAVAATGSRATKAAHYPQCRLAGGRTENPRKLAEVLAPRT